MAVYNLFEIRKRNKEIKKIFSHLNGWKFHYTFNNGIVYYEINFKSTLDRSINGEILRKKIYDLDFKPAVEFDENYFNKHARFYGIYQ